MAFSCEICGASPDTGATLVRQNKPGEMPAIWRCKAHNNKDKEQVEYDEALARQIQAGLIKTGMDDDF